MPNPQTCATPDSGRQPRRYATTAEAAAYIGVTPRTVRQMIADKRIAAYRNGSRIIRIDLDELDAAMTRIGGEVEEPARKSTATEYIEKLLAEAPPLTDEQRVRLAELLAPVRKGGAA